MLQLTGEELLALVRRVFAPRPDDTGIGILVDLPDEVVPDTPAWRSRRETAAAWVEELSAHEAALGPSTRLITYRNARSNNGDLPAEGASVSGGAVQPWSEVFAQHSILIAPTQFSATAPLKVAARTFAIRAATMPGFRAEMVPALRLDYTEINRRVTMLAGWLTEAEGADLHFGTPGGDLSLHLDLRFRVGHASGGVLTEPGTAGNLPSGEAYIVPYEGERPSEPSRSAGTLPVQFDDEIVVYAVRANRAVAVEPGGPRSAAEAERLRAEPAYGNIAELGLGVLRAFGVHPIGEVLLDEKLGLHVAFGRSDHFGGQVGPGDFSSPDAVVHIDRVYVHESQPLVRVKRVDLVMPGGARRALMADDEYVPQLFANGLEEQTT